MIPTAEIDHIKKSIGIIDVLASRGIMPVSQAQNELTYHSPLRNDQKPSFHVNTQDNVFKDVVVHEHRGDVIRLVQLLDGVSFSMAMQTLRQFDSLLEQPSFFLSGSIAQSLPASKDKIREVKLLQNPALIRYVESRGISIAIARMYLREVHYSHNSRYLYAVGFTNDSEGYALRNGVGCKRNIGPSDITTLSGSAVETTYNACNVFEGFFDFLSCLVYYGVQAPKCTTYVLNSVANVHRLLPTLTKYTKINVFFDNDKAGKGCLDTLQQHFPTVYDCSSLYTRHNDFNDFLTNLSAK
ncbi:hypothetical protein EXU85_22670 [Spirosoma sp. KCTC 42546]|uniref:toprim domain-containing protein n=1 Tax=Spirosoma sp. KCTC 42546 TaxID=2520506 RepID=UPI00115845F1|nr:toprim domain-containing protein [Spirosoma sp. KCTC 42546]QDK81260.1 hypothetical protein EXU85_22670 [Spirosoma sp. KCTC 42546]